MSSTANPVLAISKTGLALFDNNRYPVAAHAVGRAVGVQACIDWIAIRRDASVVVRSRKKTRPKTSYHPRTPNAPGVFTMG